MAAKAALEQWMNAMLGISRICNGKIVPYATTTTKLWSSSRLTSNKRQIISSMQQPQTKLCSSLPHDRHRLHSTKRIYLSSKQTCCRSKTYIPLHRPPYHQSRLSFSSLHAIEFPSLSEVLTTRKDHERRNDASVCMYRTRHRSMRYRTPRASSVTCHV
ncbi:unnamed protein product, partial [Ectocarpus sp. 8 AP-2014]